MRMNMTPKQTAFCQAYLETGDASEAWRRSYDASKSNKNSVNRRGHEMLQHSKVIAYLAEERAHIMARHRITVDDLLSELEEARQLAMTADTPQSSAAVTATMGKAKLLGLDKQIIDHTSSDGSFMPTKIVLVAGRD